MATKDPKTGRFVKGSSGNPTGRPKTSKLTSVDKKEYAKILREAAKNGDIGDAAVWLCERANDTNELFKITKEFAGYLAPKKSSVKTEVSEVKELKISFLEDKEEIKVIEGEVTNNDE